MAIASSRPRRIPLSGLPADRLAATIGTWRSPALLESGPGFGEAGRYSFLTARPRLVFESVDDSWSIRSRAGNDAGSGDVLEALGRLLRKFDLGRSQAGDWRTGPPFTGGLVGYFGYDLAPQLERLPRRHPRDSRFPDVRFALHDTVVALDHANGTADLWAHDFLGEGDAALEARVGKWRRTLEAADLAAPPPRSALGPVRGLVSRQGYLEGVRRVLEYIAAGDVFQINLSQRFQASGCPEPLDLYLRLKARSPSPFSSFLKWGDLAIVGASPEWFYQSRGSHLVTRPIKGTRRRGASTAEDRALVAELTASAKDRAELTMIVDLERNDLGRVCRYGTVRVVDPLAIESFAQVHHLVATVEGDLRPDLGPMDVVRALFPGGSITGAPKIRAMEIIDELEPARRGVYTGAVGYYGRGTSAFNIAIRTLLVEGGRVSYQVGGGIVTDSDPEAEYQETLHKGSGLRSVLEEGEEAGG